MDWIFQVSEPPSSISPVLSPFPLYSLFFEICGLTYTRTDCKSLFQPVRDIAKYAAVASHFVAFLINTHDDEKHIPLYTEDQRTVIAEYISSLECASEFMDLQDVVGSHLHRLLIANVCYRIRSFIDSTDFPIVRFLCYFSQVDGVFSPPSHVTEMVAALQYFIRVVVLNLGRNSTIEDVSSHEPVPAYHQFVREGLQTPFAQIREIMHLASSFAVNQTSVPRVYWLNDVGTSLLIDGNRIDLEHIRSWIARGIKETSNLLYGLVMKGYRCVSDISISEDYRNLTPGYSFLSSDNVGAFYRYCFDRKNGG